MAQVRGFRGLRYDLSKIGDISKVLAPPYDVISEPMRQELIARSEYNVVRLDLGDQPVGTPPDQRDYEASARLLSRWRAEGILTYDPKPAVHIYEQLYQAPPPRNDLVKRRGIILAVKIEPLGQGSILPHEGTLAEPKEDRLRLSLATSCSFSQIFGIYDDPTKKLEQVLREDMGQPLWRFTDQDGITHTMWKVDDPEALDQARETFRDTTIVIADGHHRYETAVTYRDQMREAHPGVEDAPWEYTTMFLCNVAHRSLTILPAHRMVRRLPPHILGDFEARAAELFDVIPIALRPDPAQRRRAVNELLDLMASKQHDSHVFGAYWGRSYAVALRLRDKQRALQLYGHGLSETQRDLDVALLHAVAIRGLLQQTEDLAKTSGRGNIYFERDPLQCLKEVDEGRAAMALLCNPTRVEDVLRVAYAGERMPQKGTYFWPKPLAGIVMYDMRPDAPTLQ